MSRKFSFACLKHLISTICIESHMIRAVFEHPTPAAGETVESCLSFSALVWESGHGEKTSEPRFTMQLTENRYFYYWSQLKSHFWVHWHSPKMWCLALTFVQLSQLSAAFPCRGRGPFTHPLLWCPLVMRAETSQGQTENLGTTSMFLWTLQWNKEKQSNVPQCLGRTVISTGLCWRGGQRTGFIAASALVTSLS